MTGCRTISTVVLVGDGSGLVEPGDITVPDIAASISRPTGNPDTQDKRVVERVWIPDRDLERVVGISPPDPEDADTADAVIVIAGLTLPDGFEGTPASDLTIDITVAQVEDAKARGCPSCDSDMAETFEDGGCTVCGFYFDGDHLDNTRQAELDRIREQYQDGQ